MPSGHALERIRLRFATFRDASADERVALGARLREIATDERLLLDTCHRVELLSVDDAPLIEPVLTGRDAIHRAFTVVAGFDSAVVAEEQLLGQARRAYEAAQADGTTGPILNELYRRALRFGRRVRSHARPGADRSLADRGASWMLDRIGSEPAEVVVAGTGEIGRLIGGRLAAAGHAITVVSGSADRGERAFGELGRGPHRLLIGPIGRSLVGGSNAIALALRPAEPVLTADHLDGVRPWTLDLSTPPAVSPDAAERLGDRLMTVDELGRLGATASALTPRAERRLRRELEAEVDAFVAWLDTRRSGDALAQLHGDAAAIRQRHLDRLRRSGALAPEQMAAVEAATSAMIGELLHGPSVALRRGRAEAPTVRRLFGLGG